MTLEDENTEGGVLLRHRFRVFVPEADALRAAFDEAVADRVLIADGIYVVETSQSWPGAHTEAVILRET